MIMNCVIHTWRVTPRVVWCTLFLKDSQIIQTPIIQPQMAMLTMMIIATALSVSTKSLDIYRHSKEIMARNVTVVDLEGRRMPYSVQKSDSVTSIINYFYPDSTRTLLLMDDKDLTIRDFACGWLETGQILFIRDASIRGTALATRTVNIFRNGATSNGVLITSRQCGENTRPMLYILR